MQDPSHPYISEGYYDVTLLVTSDSGCFDDTTRQIWVYPEPIANFTFLPDETTIINPYITFTDASYDADFSYWDFGDSSPIFTGTDTSHYYNDTGTYNIQLITENTFGCRDSITFFVIIKDDYTLFAPNTFSPNNDGMNDDFMPDGIGLYAEGFEMYIYNRWGALIYQTVDLKEPWDGKKDNDNKAVPEGVYVWKVHTIDSDGKKHQYVGHVTLIR